MENFSPTPIVAADLSRVTLFGALRTVTLQDADLPLLSAAVM
jgi:hypothetical protein